MATVLTSSLFKQGITPIPPERFNLARHSLGRDPLRDDDKTALEVIGSPGEILERWTYGELRETVLRTIGGFEQLGIQPGDRVALLLPSTSMFPVLFFALTGMGAIAVPTSPLLKEEEFARVLDDLSPKAVCLGEGMEIPLPRDCLRLDWISLQTLSSGPVAEFANPAADDPAFILYTSGTSGNPKGVLHAHRAAYARRMMWRDWYGLGSDDRVLHAGAFNWSYTLGAGLMDPWANGATALIALDPGDGAFWAEVIKTHHPSIFAAAPGIYRKIMKSGAEASSFASLRHGLSAGEALSGSLRQGWQELTGLQIFEALGMTEVSTYISASPFAQDAHPRPQPGRHVAILAEAGDASPVDCDQPGLLAVHRSDPGLMLGYWKKPGQTDEAYRDNWFITGDRARMASDGKITHLGRADAVLTAGGYRIDATEIEEVLLSHPWVSDACAVDLGVSDQVRIIAAMVATDHGDLAESELLALCSGKLARYKQPREIFFAASLPRTTTGKLKRKDVSVLAHDRKTRSDDHQT